MPRRKSVKLYPSPSHSKREYRNYDAEEDGIAVRRDTAWSSHYRVIRSSRAKQGVTTHSYPCVQGEGRVGSIATRRNSSRKIDPSLSLSRSRTSRVPLKLRLSSLDLDPVPRLSLTRERGTGERSSSSTPHFKERDPVTRFNLFRCIEAWTTDPSRRSSPGNNIRICSTWNSSWKRVFFHAFSSLELFKIIALRSCRVISEKIDFNDHLILSFYLNIHILHIRKYINI